MNKTTKWLMTILVLALFVVMGIVGIKFILQAERSASGIEKQVPLNKSNLNMNNLNLSPPSSSAVVASDVVSINPALNQVGSVGSDAVITRGEFAYRAGQPVVSVLLKNQGHFPIKSVHVSLFLRLNGEKQNVAEEIAVPIELPHVLAQDETVRIQVPALQASWSAESVAQAQSRQVLAQIVSVYSENGDESNDYPQNSAMVSLKQTANDWTLPDDDNNATPDPNYVEPDSLDEAVEEANEEEQNEDETESEQPQVDVVQQILDEQKLPEKNETGIISHQEKMFKK